MHLSTSNYSKFEISNSVVLILFKFSIKNANFLKWHKVISSNKIITKILQYKADVGKHWDNLSVDKKKYIYDLIVVKNDQLVVRF